MGLSYRAVEWNRQKKIYDLVMLVLMLAFLLLFGGLTLLWRPETTTETLLIRATGSLAFFMLHVVLAIGPLARLDVRFLPLLYNRRHLGVATALVAALHGFFKLVQFHALGQVNPLVSLFTSNTHYNDLGLFPFQTLGFFALLILLIMAATSHDFWLKNLSPSLWKALHMSVYVAYVLLVLHVLLGVVQSEGYSPAVLLMGAGMFTLLVLHLTAAGKSRLRKQALPPTEDGFQLACRVGDIPEDRAVVLYLGGENIAIFRYERKLSAISNVCKHQNGPLGEGKVVDGCVTCPWHGYQYLPQNGQSPPPFTEKVATYPLLLRGEEVWIKPEPLPEGTYVEPQKLFT